MRTSLLGCPVDNLTMSETVARARAAMKTRERLQHVALNVAKLVAMRSDRILADDIMTSDMVGADGAGIVLASWCVGVPIKERVAGIDLLNELLVVCAQEGFRPYFLGATADVVRYAANNVAAKYPSIQFAGLRDGYFGDEEETRIVDEIRNSSADCLFIGMPTPRKERFLATYRDALGVPFIMGVGGSFDILAGQVRRAPLVLQKAGLEWLYRIYQEPGRMWWRYTKTNSIFLGMLTWAVVERIFGRVKQVGGASL